MVLSKAQSWRLRSLLAFFLQAWPLADVEHRGLWRAGISSTSRCSPQGRCQSPHVVYRGETEVAPGLREPSSCCHQRRGREETRSTAEPEQRRAVEGASPPDASAVRQPRGPREPGWSRSGPGTAAAFPPPSPGEGGLSAALAPRAANPGTLFPLRQPIRTNSERWGAPEPRREPGPAGRGWVELRL